MTQKSNSKVSFFAIITFLSIVVFTHADDLELVSNNHLTGTIRSISAEGVVELSTVLAPEPIFLKPDAVKKVVFSHQASKARPDQMLIELVNGDLLPVSVESLTDRELRGTTTDFGTFVIPRAALKSIQTSNQEPSIIYEGPKNLKEWSTGLGHSKNWEFTEYALSSSGIAVGSKKFNLP
jgi:hypothetical protein